MHEEALLRDLVQKVEEVARTQGATSVVRLRFWIGALSHLSEETLRTRWPISARGTSSERATLEVERSADLDHPQATSVILRSLDVATDERRPPVPS